MNGEDRPADDEALVWSNIYLSFPMSRAERRVLDEHLRGRGTSLSIRLRSALAETLREAGVSLPRIE